MSIHAFEEERSGWKFVEPGVMGYCCCRPNHKKTVVGNIRVCRAAVGGGV